MTTPKGEKEIKIEGEAKSAEELQRPTPDVEADFEALLKDYGVPEKAALIVTKHIADTGSDRVFESPMELLEKLAKFPRQIPPVTRKNILDHWIAQNKIPVPEEYETEAEKPAEEIRRRGAKVEKEEAKYAVDTDTGAIRVASTTDKTALTWDEAEKLSQKTEKKLAEKTKKESEKGEKKVTYVYDSDAKTVRMAKEGETGGTLEQAKELRKMAEEGKGKGEEGEKAKYSVDEDTGAIKVATTSEKALSWPEAEKLSKTIKKEIAERGKGKEVKYVYDPDAKTVRMSREGETGGTLEQAKELKKMAEEGKGKGEEESPFIVGEEGLWMLNPKARITGLELMAFESIRKAQERGEPVDPIEMLGKAGEKMKIYREALGGGEGKLPEWMTDPVKFIETVERISGGGKGDEGLKTELSEMRKTIDDMKEQRYKEQIESQQRAISTLTDKVGELSDLVVDLKRPVTGRTEMDLLHEIASEGIGVVKTELPGFRRDIRDALAGGALPAPKTAKEREDRTAKLRHAVQTDKEVEEIGRRLFFGEG